MIQRDDGEQVEIYFARDVMQWHENGKKCEQRNDMGKEGIYHMEDAICCLRKRKKFVRKTSNFLTGKE